MNEVKRISVGSKALASYTDVEVKNCLNSAIRQENIATDRIFDDFFLIKRIFRWLLALRNFKWEL